MLNGPREIDYKFRVFVWQEWVWLYDASEVTYACSVTPSLYGEPMYPQDHDDFSCPVPTYFGEEVVDLSESKDLMTLDKDMNEEEAWELARDETYENRPL